MRLTETRRLTSLKGDCLGATFSPDGQFIAFSCDSEGHSDIYRIQRDGGDLTRLTESGRGREGGAYFDPHFSPDGARLVCTWVHGPDGAFSDLYAIDVQSSGAGQPLTDTRDNGSPAFSPDGQHIVFTSARATHYRRCAVSEIFRMTRDGREQTRLTHTDFTEGKKLVLRPRNLHPCYSPEGDFIAFTSSRQGIPGENRFEIYRMRPDGSEQLRLTDTHGSSSYPLWHPHGSHLAFTSWVSQAETPRTNRSDIYLVDKEGAHTRCLDEGGAINWLGGFHPGGRYLAFDSTRGNATPEVRNNWDIFVLNVESGQVHRLTENAVLDRKPIFSPDGTTLLFTSEREGNGSLYLGHIEF